MVVEVLATGLWHPEGPDLLPNGDIVMVESFTSKIVAWTRSGVRDVAFAGGGPNACLLGSDGALYVTQNGGTVGGWMASVVRQPSIQRITLEGAVETIVTSVDGVALQAPNDLTFGADGRLYFTDPPDYTPNDRGTGRLFAVSPGGRGELLEELPGYYPNGIASGPNGDVVWVESFERGVYRLHPGRPSELLCRLPPGHIPDGIKFASDGSIWIASVTSGGVDVVSPDGEFLAFHPTSGQPLNCLFVGTSLIITDGGASPKTGRLTRIQAGISGNPLRRGTL
jgi:gluconolactonase